MGTFRFCMSVNFEMSLIERLAWGPSLCWVGWKLGNTMMIPMICDDGDGVLTWCVDIGWCNGVRWIESNSKSEYAQWVCPVTVIWTVCGKTTDLLGISTFLFCCYKVSHLRLRILPPLTSTSHQWRWPGAHLSLTAVRPSPSTGWRKPTPTDECLHAFTRVMRRQWAIKSVACSRVVTTCSGSVRWIRLEKAIRPHWMVLSQPRYHLVCYRAFVLNLFNIKIRSVYCMT